MKYLLLSAVIIKGYKYSGQSPIYEGFGWNICALYRLVSLVATVIQYLIASCNQKIRLSVWTDAENDYIN